MLHLSTLAARGLTRRAGDQGEHPAVLTRTCEQSRQRPGRHPDADGQPEGKGGSLVGLDVGVIKSGVGLGAGMRAKVNGSKHPHHSRENANRKDLRNEVVRLHLGRSPSEQKYKCSKLSEKKLF